MIKIDSTILKNMRGVYFISGIDTDIGKTIATGQLAAALQPYCRVISQKLVQTGNVRFSDDIVRHRQMMGGVQFPEDHKPGDHKPNNNEPENNKPKNNEPKNNEPNNTGTENFNLQHCNSLTAPLCFGYPASPHLAARLDGITADFNTVQQATAELAARYDVVLLEGAGGLLVPLSDTLLTLDYVSAQGYSVILVTSGRLGSINHTLLSLMALRHYKVELFALVFNHYHDNQDAVIAADTADYLRHYLQHHFPMTIWLELEAL